MGIINETLGSDNATIGKIEVMKKFSFFEFEYKKKTILIENLSNQIFEGKNIVIEVAKEKPVSGKKDNHSNFNKKNIRSKKNRSKRKHNFFGNKEQKRFNKRS